MPVILVGGRGVSGASGGVSVDANSSWESLKAQQDTADVAATPATRSTVSLLDPSTSVADADSAAAVDAASLTVTFFRAVTGSRADFTTGVGVATVAASLTAADTATGTEAATVTVTLTAADAVGSVDTATVAASSTTADTATSADAASPAASVAAADLAAGVDTTGNRTLTAADTTSSVDTATLAAQLAANDLALALELAQLVAAIAAADLAATADAASLDVLAPPPDYRHPDATIRTGHRDAGAARPRYTATGAARPHSDAQLVGATAGATLTSSHYDAEVG